MKKMTIMCMAALLVMAVSCKKEKVNEEYTGDGFRATTESHTGNGDSKTQLLGDLSVTWCEGDEIMVFSRNDSEGKKFSAANAGTTADFNPVDDVTDEFFSPTYTAFYPVSAVTGTNQITLQGTQHYTMTDGVLTFAPGENPMAAQSNCKVLPFRNLCGILEFQLSSENPCTVKSICVTSLKTGEQLWGTGTVTFDGTDATLGTLTGGSASITLDCGDGVSLGSQPTDFFVVIPGGALSEGFRLTVTDTNGKVWNRTTYVSNTITKSKIKAMPDVSVETHDPVTPSAVSLDAGCSHRTYIVAGSVTVPSGNRYPCEFGLVYSESDDTPTIEEGAQKVVAGVATFDGTKEFAADLPSLDLNKNYYMCAYAMVDGIQYSSATLIYGNNVPLSMTWTGGKSPKQFSVSSTEKVYFSQGNLQYLAKGGSGGNASATAASGANVGGTWRFALHQFDFVGPGNEKAAWDYDGWIDLFCWGTSGYNHGATCYQPWSTSKGRTTDYKVYDNSNYSLYDSDGTADWGANAISNGGNQPDKWRMLTKEEWVYLIDTRKDDNNKVLYGKGTIGNCAEGLIVLPDGWSCPSDLTDVVRGKTTMNYYTYSEWAQLETAGAVFLPVAGYRYGTTMYETGNCCYYSSTRYSNSAPYALYFYSSTVDPDYTAGFRDYASSIRLVSKN